LSVAEASGTPDRLSIEQPADGAPVEVLSPAEPGSEGLARARLAFLNEERLTPGVVRTPIVASWTRSRLWRVRPERLDLPFEPDVDSDTILTRAAEPVLRDIADLFASEPMSVILCDAQGYVLSRRTGDSDLERALNRIWLAPGFSYAERYVGTNGIGTALEARGPAHVFGHEHFTGRLEDFACAGVPIRHPATGRVLGVVDLTGWRRDAGALMVATAATLGRSIEEALLAQVGRRELAVLNDYLVACRRHRGAVVALADDLLMMNDRARQILDAADQGPLLTAAAEALAAGKTQPVLVDLPSRRAARVQCRPTVSDGAVVGGVVDVHVTDASGVPRPRRPAQPPAHTAAAVGSGAAWTSCCWAVDRHLQSREWLLLEGEPGSGRVTVARAAHQTRTPTTRLRVVRFEEHGPRWVVAVAEELAVGPGTLVLPHLDRVPPEVLEELADALEPYRESTDPERTWVVATVDRTGPDDGPELARVLGCFPSTVQVPPLRQHLEDVAELVPHLLARLTRGAALSCSPEALRVLMHNRWPGNVEQLVQVLRKVVARRRSGVIEVGDLPPECRITTRRVLTPLEALECDAIVGALSDAQGNKVEAARRLAMSRATIYRKIRDYGISLPAPAGTGR
jgi:transcriptional regulator of acetoin/glycerol metabolism